MNKKGHLFINCVLSGILLILVLVFCFALYRYSAAPRICLVAAVIAAIGAIFTAISLRFCRESKINFLIVLFSFTASIYAVELFSFWFYSAKIFPESTAFQATRFGVEYDTRTRGEVYEDLLVEGVDATPSVYPRIFTSEENFLQLEGLFPVGGIAKTTSVYCNENGQYTIYQSDEFGFNNPLGSFQNFPIEIMVIGDSYAQGGCVQLGEDVGSVLRNNGKSIVSLGQAANGPLIELASLKEFAAPFKPQTILWLYYEGNDLTDLSQEKESTILMKYLGGNFSQHLIGRQDEVDKKLRAFVAIKSNRGRNYVKTKKGYRLYRKFKYSRVGTIMLLTHIRKLLTNFFTPVKTEETINDQVVELFAEVIKEANDIIKEWGGDLYFVYLPEWQRYTRNVDHVNFRNRGEILSILKGLEIPIVDMHEAFLDHPDLLSLFPFRVSGHYNKAGYQYVASTISKKLEEKVVERKQN